MRTNAPESRRPVPSVADALGTTQVRMGPRLTPGPPCTRRIPTEAEIRSRCITPVIAGRDAGQGNRSARIREVGSPTSRAVNAGPLRARERIP